VPESCASAAASPLGARTPVAAPRAPARCPSGHAGARSSRSPVAERPRRARADLGCPSDRANSGGRIAGKGEPQASTAPCSEQEPHITSWLFTNA